MAPKQPNTGLFVGLNRGHIVTKKELAPRPSDRKGVRKCIVHLDHFVLLILSILKLTCSTDQEMVFPFSLYISIGVAEKIYAYQTRL